MYKIHQSCIFLSPVILIFSFIRYVVLKTVTKINKTKLFRTHVTTRLFGPEVSSLFSRLNIDNVYWYRIYGSGTDLILIVPSYVFRKSYGITYV